MDSVLDKKVVISLNKGWQAIGYQTIGGAIKSMFGDPRHPDKPPALALDLEYDDEGNLIRATPLGWDEWIKLPVRASDLAVNTSRGPIRAPTLIISQTKQDMPRKAPALRNRSIFDRDNNTCQYTGRKLSPKQLTVDHVIPLHRGGKNTWENMVTCEKTLNHKKGHKLNEELGLKLLRAPVAPKELPVSAFVKEVYHNDHKAFVQS